MFKTLWQQAALVGTALIAGSAWFRSWGVTGSVTAGVAFALVNFWLLTRIIGSLQGSAHPAWLVARVTLKLVLSSVALWWLVTQSSVQPVPLLMGLSCVVIPILGIGLGVTHARV